MNKQLIVLLCLSLTNAFSQTINVMNNSKNDRKDAVVEIPWSSVVAKNTKIDTTNFKVIDAVTKKELPFQLERQGTKNIKNLLVQLSVGGKSTTEITIEAGKPATFPAKTYARYVPERLDDFAWENDKIAFRTYGKALEGTKGDAYGFDVWSKRTSDLIINRRYKHGNYHKDLGDGLDYYHVGLTLGAGNIAPIVGDKIYYGGNYHRYKILENGPLRTTFTLEYDEWMVGNQKVTAEKTISIDAGAQLYKVEAKYHFITDTLALAIGIIKRPEPGIINLNEKTGIMTYWEPEHGKDGITGVGIYTPAKVYKMQVTDEQLLTYVSVKKDDTFTYYAGASWSKAGEITKPQDWTKYMSDFKNQLVSTLKITVK